MERAGTAQRQKYGTNHRQTVAGLLNDRGGTLLIGVTDSREPVGLDDDYAHVKPPNADGYVNWLDTLFENHLGDAGANRLDIRIDRINNHDICRIDIPPAPDPMWVKKKKGTNALYQRRNKLHPTKYQPTRSNLHHRAIRTARIRRTVVNSSGVRRRSWTSG